MIQNSSSLSIYLVYAFNILGQQSIDHLNSIMMRNCVLSWLWTVIRTLLHVSVSPCSRVILYIPYRKKTRNQPGHQWSKTFHQCLCLNNTCILLVLQLINSFHSFGLTNLARTIRIFSEYCDLQECNASTAISLNSKVLFLLLPSQVVKRDLIPGPVV